MTSIKVNSIVKSINAANPAKKFVNRHIPENHSAFQVYQRDLKNGSTAISYSYIPPDCSNESAFIVVKKDGSFIERFTNVKSTKSNKYWSKSTRSWDDVRRNFGKCITREKFFHKGKLEEDAIDESKTTRGHSEAVFAQIRSIARRKSAYPKTAIGNFYNGEPSVKTTHANGDTDYIVTQPFRAIFLK